MEAFAEEVKLSSDNRLCGSCSFNLLHKVTIFYTAVSQMRASIAHRYELLMI